MFRCLFSQPWEVWWVLNHPVLSPPISPPKTKRVLRSELSTAFSERASKLLSEAGPFTNLMPFSETPLIKQLSLTLLPKLKPTQFSVLTQQGKFLAFPGLSCSSHSFSFRRRCLSLTSLSVARSGQKNEHSKLPCHQNYQSFCKTKPNQPTKNKKETSKQTNQKTQKDLTACIWA